MDEQVNHTVVQTPEGKVVDKMSEAISKALSDTFNSYVPKYSKIQASVLSFFAIRDGSDFLSSDYMTEEQIGEVTNYFKTVMQPYQVKFIEQFKQKVPQARVVEIPNGHHYCFMKQEELVYEEMRRFLLE